VLRLTCFGGLQLEAVSDSSSHPKRLALLALLAASDRGVSRDRAMSFLWPESDEERARNALKQMVHAIRTELGPVIESPPHGHLTLAPAVVSSDVADFRAALARGDLESAAYVYGGPFLDGFYLRDAPEFERWVEDERRQLGGAFTDALEQLAKSAAARKDLIAAARWWKRRADADPLSARVARELVTALAATGDREAALRQAATYESLVRAELGVGPDASFLEVVERLKREEGGGRREETAERKMSDLPSSLLPPPSSLPPPPSRKPYALGAAALAIGIVLAAVMLGSGRTPSLLSAGKLTSQDRIIVARFAHRGSSDSTLGLVVSEALASDLRQSNAVALVGPAQISGALRRMGKSPSAVVDDSVAREIARRDGIKAVLAGTVDQVSGGFVLTARLFSADSAQELTSARSVATGASDLLPAIQALSHQLRAQIGESLRRVRGSPALSDVTTPSFEALRKYAEGWHAWNFEFNRHRAQTLLEEAVAIDSGFALAWRLLAVIYDGGRQADLSSAAMARAYRNISRLSERERLIIELDYFGYGPGYDRAKAITAVERLIRGYPDFRGVASTLGNLYRSRRQFAKAESVYRANLSPDFRVMYVGLTRALVNQRKLAAAESVTASYAQHFQSAQGDVGLQLGWLFYIQRNVDSAVAVQPTSHPNPGTRALALSNLSGLERLRGRLALSARYRLEADAIYRTLPGARDPLEVFLDSATVALNYRRDPALARSILERGLNRTTWDSIPKGARQPLRISRLFAQAGDPTSARRFVRRLDLDVGSDTALRRHMAPLVSQTMAQILSAEGKHEEALAAYRSGLTRSDGPIDECIPCEDVDFGRLFDAAGQPDSALARYERYLASTNASLFTADRDYLPPVLLRVGDLHSERGARDKAYPAYARLAQLWHQADPALRPTLDRVRSAMRAIERAR
jgi:DNA-binding SARP family transcriptional activator